MVIEMNCFEHLPEFMRKPAKNDLNINFINVVTPVSVRLSVREFYFVNGLLQYRRASARGEALNSAYLESDSPDST